MTGGSYPARPARPVADAPIAALADADALAKGWLLTLIAGAPLQSVAEVSTDELAREAPQLCKAIIAALGSDTALARLEDDGDLHAVAARAGGMTGATDAAGSMAAMAALRASLWNAVAEELHHPEPEFVGALATRLSRVCDVVAAAALAQDARVFAASQFADAAGTKHAAQVEPGVSGEPPVAVKPVEPDRPDESAAPSGDAEPTPVAPDTTAPDDVIAHLGVATLILLIAPASRSWEGQEKR